MARTPNRDEIERKAYELYEQRGCKNGHAEEDWFAAERELAEGLDASEGGKAGSRIKTAVTRAMQQKLNAARSGRN
jgi:Protein of unknown function (DUF2934)